MIVLLVILIVSLILPFIQLIEFIKYKLYNKRKLKMTKQKVRDFKFIFGVFGEVGIGKSTLCAGVFTSLEEDTKELIQDKIEYTYTIIDNMNFIYLNHVIRTICQSNFDVKKEDLFEFVFNIIKKYCFNKKGEDYIYYDGIKEHKYSDIFLDYLEAKTAEYRNNYMYCNINYKSVITGNRSYYVNSEDMKIKDRFANEDFILRRYSNILFDDVLFEAQKLNFNWQLYTSEDSGSIEFLREYRHLFKETCRYGVNLQNAGRLVKAERELFNHLIEVKEKSYVEMYKLPKRVYLIIDWIHELNHNIKVKLTRNKDKLEAKDLKYRKTKKWLKHKLDMLYSKDFIKYDVEVFKTSKDAENSVKSASRFETLYFPVKWCHSPIDTHEYAYLYDALIQKSNKSPAPKESNDYIEDKIEHADIALAK